MRIYQFFHFKGSVIQNLPVVSCRLSVSVSFQGRGHPNTWHPFGYGWLGDICPHQQCLLQISIPGPLHLEFNVLLTELPGAPVVFRGPLAMHPGKSQIWYVRFKSRSRHIAHLSYRLIHSIHLLRC